MRKVYFVIAFLLISSATFGQITRELDVFRQLDVTDKIVVNLIPSTFNKIIISGELANQVELIQVDDVLKLKMTGTYILQGSKVSVTLHTTNLSTIISRKGAQVNSDNKVLKSDSIYLSANEGAEIDLAIHVKNVKVLSTTGARIFVDGKAHSQDIEIAAGGSYLSRDLISEHAIVRVSAGGKALLNVSKSLDAQTRAGGIIDVYGDPKERKQKRFAGGKINYF